MLAWRAVVALYIAVVLHGLGRGLTKTVASYAVKLAAWLVPLAMVTVYQVLSVYLGWHYAVDGYVSTVLMCALCWWLMRR